MTLLYIFGQCTIEATTIREGLAMNPTKICNCLMLLSLCCIPHFGIAQTIQIPVASQGGAHATLDRPQTGLSGAAVLERFGEPLNTTPAVGEPPISRWEYAEFYVYFEYSHVVHTVLKHKPTR